MSWESALSLFLSTLRVSTPLVFASLGGLLSERAGVINIALEGMMLGGAFGAAAATYGTGSPWIGLLAGCFSGMILALIYAVAVIPLRSNQIVAGTALNLLALGLTPFLCKILYDSGGSSPSLPIEARFTWEPILLAAIAVGGIAAMMRWTPAGLWVQFAGEHPAALEAAGVRVRTVRWLAVAASGVLAGAGGATLSIFLSSSFTRNMTSGRGFMALAALIFGKWKPVPAALACLLFAFSDAVQIRLQGVALWGDEPVPVQFVQMLPYLFTVIVLAGWVGRSRAPRALGNS
jgi:ABC-type uncharacterized transport system permease subunit